MFGRWKIIQYPNSYSYRSPSTTALSVRSLFLSLFFSLGIQLALKAQESRMHHNPDYNPYTGNISIDSLPKDYIILNEILIEGIKITKEKIILREIGYKQGDTIQVKNITTKLLWIKNRIFNTTLFFWVDLEINGIGHTKTMIIRVRERLFISILPTGGLADRNINEWLQDRGGDFARTYYGIKLKLKNIFGLNHTLQTKAVVGFNQKIEANYLIPYLNSNQKTGLNVSGLMEWNPQVAYRTFEHKLDYLEANSVGRRKFTIGFQFSRRNKFYLQHHIGPYFQYASIDDTIAYLNPIYFLNGTTFQRSYGLKYNLTLDRRDFINYPLKGNIMRLEADYQYLVSNFSIPVTSLKGEYSLYFPIVKNFYWASSAIGKLSTPTQQPYFTQRGLGYNKEIISGYERYVIDGQVFVIIKSSVKWQVFSINPSLKFIPHHKFRTLPLSMYLKLYGDMGYVVDNTVNPFNDFLSNKFLKGGGVGVDLVTYFDLVGRIEYSINQLGETGIFLHLKTGI